MADEEVFEEDLGGDRFLGHIVDRSFANVFVDFWEHVDHAEPMIHHVLDGTRGDGWHFWVAPGGVLLVTVREYGKTYHYPLAGVRRCIVLPRRGGDPLDPFAPAQPVCEYDSEVIEDVTAMEQELIVLDAGKGELKAVFFHNADCLAAWKEEQGGTGQAEGSGEGEGS